MDLTAPEALARRMTGLLLRPSLLSPPPASVSDVVCWFGAMQAQDLASGLWSLGARLPAATMLDVQAALENGEALRTWPMRGTVHLVPSRDARWMLELMGARPLAQAAARREHLGLSEATADHAVDILGGALAGGGRLTRAECLTTLAAAGITGAGQFGYHLLWYASQRGVTCLGPTIGKEQTFVLLDEWAPDPHRLTREESLATIALRYFRSHGPTTRQDFAGWTGLTATDAKHAIAAAGPSLVSVTVEGREMFLEPTALDQPTARWTAGEIVALPGFDEYLLGFKDRSLMLDPEHQQAIIPGGNGIFQATIVRDGRVIGTWKRSISSRGIVVSVRPLVALEASERTQIEGALVPYSRFMQTTVDIRWL
jgi:hypothetical protein